MGSAVLASRRLHYGWVIVAAGTLTIFACLGLGRFALGMLLPSMGVALDLGYDQMGYIGTGNFVGYLAAVFAARWLVRGLGSRATIAGGLFLVGASMVLVGQAASFAEVLILYVLTGAGSAVANVPMMGLVSLWFARRLRGRAAGWIVIGSGPGIIFSGTLIPALNAAEGVEGWRTGWLVLGAVVIAIAALCAFLLRNRPEDLKLTPAGEGPEPERAPAEQPPRSLLVHLGVIYALFGATYATYATFVVTSLVQDHGFGEADAGHFWMWLGVFSLASGPVFGTLSDRIGRRGGLIVVFALHATAYTLAALPLPAAGLYLSIALFGISAWSIPSIMAAAVGDYVGPERAATAFGFITLIFGMGQISGPAIAGVVAEAAGGFQASFAVAAAMAASAIVLTLLLTPPPRASHHG